MDLNQLEYFQCVAKYEHIGKAADELHMTQPAISMSIKRLEDELGFNLFDRDKKILKLNSCGRLFLKYVSLALKNIETGTEKAKILNDSKDCSFTVMFPSGLITRRLMSRLYEEIPNISLQNLSINYLQARAELGKTIDMCILAPAVEGDGIETILIERQENCVITSKDSHLASISSCHLADLANEKFVSFPDNSGPGIKVNEFCGKAGFIPDISFVCTSARTMIPPVQAGCGIGIIPIAGHGGINFNDLHIITLEDDFIYQNLTLSYMKERKKNPVFCKLIDIIMDTCIKKQQ